MTEEKFRSCWAMLRPGLTVRHWSAEGRYAGDGFVIEAIEGSRIFIKGRQYYIPVEHFYKILPIWADYCQHVVPRKRLDEKRVSTTHVISILHWMEENSKQPTTKIRST